MGSQKIIVFKENLSSKWKMFMEPILLGIFLEKIHKKVFRRQLRLSVRIKKIERYL